MRTGKSAARINDLAQIGFDKNFTGEYMDDLEKFAKQVFDFCVEEASRAFEETEKILQEVGEQVQLLADELIREGEAKFNEFNQWLNEQNSSSLPREEVRQRLFTLVQGNWNLAERLLESARYNYPGQSENWYWEKVIYDLERDRN